MNATRVVTRGFNLDGEQSLKRNSRLSLALHTLGHMARDPDRMWISADIAEHAGTNPVVVRRVLGQLRKAGLLISEKGHSGGWRLARSPEAITLADAYIALEEQLIASEESGKATSCTVERRLQHKVSDLMQEIEKSLIERLSRISIKELGA